MTIEADLLETLDQMPEALKQEVLHYAKYLNERCSDRQLEVPQTETDPAGRCLASLSKCAFSLPLPIELSISTDQLDSEQQEMLEKRYGYGSLAGKIFMSDDFDEPLEDLKDYM